jgi:hypothetical protein
MEILKEPIFDWESIPEINRQKEKFFPDFPKDLVDENGVSNLLTLLLRW